MIPPEIRKPFLITMGIFVMLVIGIASVFILGNENPIEEAVEDIIEHHTGIKIELSEEEV